MSFDFDKLDAFLEKNELSVNDAYCYLMQRKREISLEKYWAAVEKNKDLVGRCFILKDYDDEIQYYAKVISSRGPQSNFVSCLIFPEKPFCEFRYNGFGKGDTGNYYSGNYMFDSFEINCFEPETILNCEKISAEQFQQAAETYLHGLLNMDWEE